MRRELALVLTCALAACSSHVPRGFSSDTVVEGKDLDLPFATVWEAAKSTLRADGSRYEIELDATSPDQASRGRLRTGRGDIVVRQREDGPVLLEVQLREYVGRDYRAKARELLDAIVARAQG